MKYNYLMIESDIQNNINNLKEKQNEKSIYLKAYHKAI